MRNRRNKFRCIRQRIILCPHIPFNELALMYARLSKPLHTKQHNFQSCRFRCIRRADIAAAVSVTDGNAVFCPIICQRLDRPDRNAAFLARPFRRLRNAVFLSEDIINKFIKAIGMFIDIFLVVGIRCQPLICNGKLKSRVCVRKDRNPFICMDGRSVIQIRTNINALDTKLCKPIAKKRRHFHTEAERRNFRVAAPEQKTVAVLRHIRDQVCLRRHFADRLTSPYVLCSPVPAFPGIHVSHLLGIAARQGEHTVRTSMGRRNVFALSMHIGFTEDRFRRIGFIDSFDFICTDPCSFLPGDPLVSADATRLRMAFSIRIPVNSLHRIKDPVRGIDSGLIAKTHMGNIYPLWRIKCFASGFHMPGVTVCIRIFAVIGIWINSDDLSILTIDLTKRTAFRPHQTMADKTGIPVSYLFLQNLHPRYLHVARIRH